MDGIQLKALKSCKPAKLVTEICKLIKFVLFITLLKDIHCNVKGNCKPVNLISVSG